jgi:hypothetical protein
VMVGVVEAEFYVTDFGGFEPPAGLCWALEGNWLKGGATGREKAPAVTPPRLRSAEMERLESFSRAVRLSGSWPWHNIGPGGPNLMTNRVEWN